MAGYAAYQAIATAATTAFAGAVGFAADALFFLTTPENAIIIRIIALVAGLIFAYMHFKTFRDVVNAVFSTVKSTVLDAVSFIGAHWKLLLATFALPLLPLVEIIKNFSKVKSAIESVFGGIGKFISGVFNGIVGVVEVG